MNDNTNNNNNSNQNNNHNEVKEQHTDSLKCQIQCQENNVVMKPKESNWPLQPTQRMFPSRK